MAIVLSFKLLVLLLVLTTYLFAVAYPGGLRLSAIKRPVLQKSSIEIPPEYETHYYSQTLDHFNYYPESYATFQQRYILNFKYWGGANTSSPIFVYAGEEGDITGDVLYVNFIADLAARFKGLLLFIEHRYYGESFPFGLKNHTFQNASISGYLSSEQALADYAQVITDVKKNLSAENCPVIAVGASYGGMLASWFRLKYPHIIIGALASSAPILYFEDITPQDGYHAVVSKDFKNTSESCYNTIKKSWSEIDRVAAEPNGLLTLGKTFNVCRPLNSSQELKDRLEYIYMVSAQYDNPPDYYVENLCKAIDAVPQGTDILGRLAAGLNSFHGGFCLFVFDDSDQVGYGSWSWQTCTELVIPMGVDNNDTMFQISPFDLKNYTKSCQETFGIRPRPNWVPIQFGGRDIKSVLGNFASNIIFSNGLRDPWSSGGILEDISDSVVAIHTDEGAHCLDVLSPNATSDPAWLVAQRDKEIKIIAFWLAEYYAKLSSKIGDRTG
ncbi:hypothetical protein P3X46_033863 [Hevea brasiliensis]|uniref:Serine carboxypeptidase S28 family protein n=1 Tax=Hevea brasiliensis TaxID=3981 RepID=A0ABQ9KAX2_HEVBR|nr:uncharacterized protein LOC110673339 [Hevea brasiliensis]KAJ9129359.1 hypothetical protein P3X46_033863 [Hevea brasiliensis]